MASKVQRAKKFWESQATDLVRELMNEADFSYDELQEALKDLGVDNLQTDSLQQKIARGTFPASMLLRVLFVARRGPFHSSDEKVAALAKKLDITHTMNRLELGLARLAEPRNKK